MFGLGLKEILLVLLLALILLRPKEWIGLLKKVIISVRTMQKEIQRFELMILQQDHVQENQNKEEKQGEKE